MKFTKEYFIKKFEEIPENKWLIGILVSIDDVESHCALGHCGVRYNPDGSWTNTEEADSLEILLNPVMEKRGYLAREMYGSVWRINDRNVFNGTTPKRRILNALKGLK
jgi:hypothetical protein